MNTCLLPQKVGCTQGYHARRWRVHRVVVLEGRFYKGSLYTEFSVTLEGGTNTVKSVAYLRLTVIACVTGSVRSFTCDWHCKKFYL